MAEEALGVLRGGGGQGGAEGGVQTMDGSGRGRAQQALELGPDRLDRVQIGRGARQIAGGEARAIEQGAHGPRLVGREVVHDQHRVRLDPAQLGQEDLREPGV
ncbi:MAG TPA: hypothetical protein VFG43_01750, partial [Geminicoccaceae bacterium]|nr:hypothetical protein [Geminicoccaceae bacterium]